MAKWESYQKGLISRELNGILKRISNREWRKQKGLEDSPMKDFRKNDHWTVFATMELTEILAKKVDDIIKNTYLALERQMNVADRKMNESLKSMNTYINNQNSSLGQEIGKRFKQSAMRQNKLLTDTNEIKPKLEELSQEFTEDILKASKGIIKASSREMTQLRGNLEVEIDSMKDEMGKVEENLMDFLNNMDNDIAKIIKTKMAEIAKAVQVLNSEGKKRYENINNLNTKNHKSMNGKLDDLLQKFHVATRELKTDLNNELGKFKGETKGILDTTVQSIGQEFNKNREMMGNFIKMVEKNHKNNIELLNQQQKDLMKTLNKNHDETNKIMEREIKEVRSLVANIRGDIELIKSFLTKM